MKTPSIVTSRLTLRPWKEEDAEPLYQILAVKNMLKYFPNTDPRSLDQVERMISFRLAHWEEHGFGLWAVEPRGGNELLGWNGLQFLPETGEVEVAYLISKPYWGKGLTTEGARAALQYGFEQIGLDRIIALAHPDNKASQCVMQKLGMSFVDRAQYFGMDLYRYMIKSSSFVPEGQLRFLASPSNE